MLIKEPAKRCTPNLAVTVATSAETFVDRFCQAMQVSYQDKTGKPIDKPNWGHKKAALERALNVTFEDIDGFEMNCKARVMGNCFKHNEGKADEDFSKRYGGQVGDDLEYNTETARNH